MERPNTVAGLLAKRKELEAELKAAEKAARNIRIDLDHVDGAIRLFSHDAPRRLSHRPVAHRAKKGEMRRHVLKCLREANGPLTSLDIAKSYMEARGLEATDETAVLIRKRVGACLNSMKHSGHVQTATLPGQYKGWGLLVEKESP